MFGAYFGIPQPIKWYVSYERKGITFYLAVVDASASKTTWTQRREKAIQYSTSNDAQMKINEIKAKRKHNKIMVLKVI